ncbi:CAAX prenyl protease 1 [Neoconidiobolus thromboides FSU 785]|nr:CAAX prenyl protease 1 [Neoconidiobolus thromboides FSU 785]
MIQLLGYKELVTGFMLFSAAVEFYINYRQHLNLKIKERPLQIQDFVDAETFEKSRAYNHEKSTFRFYKDAYALLQNLVYIHHGLYIYFWDLAETLLTSLGLANPGEIAQSVAFFSIIHFVSFFLNLPLDLHYTFVLEEKYGFNKSTIGLFVTDAIKTTLLTLTLGNAALAGFIYVIKWAGSNFPIYAWIFMAVIQFIMIAIYPTVIQPLFNKFTPLEDGEMKDKIEELASSIDFPLTQLYVVDGSKRSGHSNAYFFGFFKNKRIVLFDTLIKDSTIDEILAVLAHELGHWKLNHIKYNLAISQVQLFIIFSAFSKFVYDPELYTSFGFQQGSMPIFVGFILFSLLLTPLDAFIKFGFNFVSRTFEFQADKFACDLGYTEKLRSGLIKLQLNNLGDMNPDPLYSAYNFSHPPLVERLAAMDSADDKKSN